MRASRARTAEQVMWIVEGCADDDGRRRDEGARGRTTSSSSTAASSTSCTQPRASRSSKRSRRCCATTCRTRSATSSSARRATRCTPIGSQLRIGAVRARRPGPAPSARTARPRNRPDRGRRAGRRRHRAASGRPQVERRAHPAAPARPAGRPPRARGAWRGRPRGRGPAGHPARRSCPPLRAGGSRCPRARTTRLRRRSSTGAQLVEAERLAVEAPRALDVRDDEPAVLKADGHPPTVPPP